MIKKILFSISSAILISLSITGCSSHDKLGGLPPLYYDYGYRFDETSRTERYQNHNLTLDRRSSEHKHEYIKFDYRIR